MNPYIFREIKARLTMPEVCEAYGITVKRDVALCPFHTEKRPSLHVYPDHFYCFGCGAGGDVIRFVARLFALPDADAARKLNTDFSLGLLENGKISYRAALQYEQKQRERAALRSFRECALNVLCTYHRFLWKQRQEPDPTSPDFVRSLLDLDRVEYDIACVLKDAADFQKTNGKEVERLAGALREKGLL